MLIFVLPLADGVKLCKTFEEARDHFFYLRNQHAMVNGGECFQVLCQEYLKGREYVVDHVSLNGEHKTMMTWLYDKRAVNGGSFVYFGEIPVEADSPEAQQLIPYARQVLDALGVKAFQRALLNIRCPKWTVTAFTLGVTNVVPFQPVRHCVRCRFAEPNGRFLKHVIPIWVNFIFDTLQFP